MRPTCTSAFKFTGLAVIGFLSGPTWSQTPRAIAIGDSVDTVRQVLGVTTALIPANNSTPGSQALPQWDRGLMVFFDSSNRVYRIRLTPPFSSAVCGARLGDPRQAILELLGPPSRKFPSPTFPDRTSYVYECDSIMSVRYDFTANDRLSGIFILSGSIPVPPVVAASTNVAVRTDAEPANTAAGSPQVNEPRAIAGLQSAGQLAPTHDLGCLTVDEVKSVYTGADLYHATRKCLDEDQFDKGAQLFALAGTYGRYDVERIADKTVSGGLTILMQDVGDGLTDDRKRAFLAATVSLHDDPKKHAQFCARVAALGPPKYLPTYLISHGLGLTGARPGGEDGLVTHFDHAAVWASLLSDGLRCHGH